MIRSYKSREDVIDFCRLNGIVCGFFGKTGGWLILKNGNGAVLSSACMEVYPAGDAEYDAFFFSIKGNYLNSVKRRLFP